MTNNSKKQEVRTFTRRYQNEYHFLRWCFHIFTIYLGLPFFKWTYQINVKGKENIPKGSHYIYAANHVSMFDPLWVSTAVFKPIAYMAKKELFEDKCNLQWWVKRLGSFSVNRQKPELSTFKTIKDIFKTNWALGIFPQGGIKDNKKIENIHKGFAVIANNAHADIIPVAISGFEGYSKNVFKSFHAQKVTLTIGKPISHKLSPEEITIQWAKFISENTGFENCMLTYNQKEIDKNEEQEKASI